ncbi:MAG TPA: LacI family DNA-binding transcriptional regulator [Clostridia bacterium]|nr:LacI family DNA-binding transcriptional regulator [Clostridia bacterium]HQA97178.1 LacI family DNA-binding transcriptional regulator [Clostridia bacterium]HQO55639.1 LacI family DNA-binding transcriptional regulator [Clostridia bacterium]HUM61350.1 LacI family DNA-binding transcriptional regulator [Clostridia bacterium]
MNGQAGGDIVTIHDVAREAGVSISTVSNVVNGVNKVSPRTREKVLRAVHLLNYIPNVNARMLKTRRCNTIGLFVSSIQGEYYTLLAQAIHRECIRAGVQMSIHVGNNSTGEEVYAVIASSGVAGAIIMDEALDGPWVERLRLRGLPLVFIDRELVGPLISSVIIDNYRGAKQAMDYLLGLGHRRIGFIRGLDNRDGQDRYRAYRDSLRARALPLETAYVLQGFFEYEIAYRAVRGFLDGGLTLPDAFFCANDETAWGCIRALAERGIKVPEDLSVMGFDNIVMSAYYTPPLSTVINPVTELGTRATLELLRLMDSPHAAPGCGRTLMPEMVLRASCAERTASGRAPQRLFPS